MDGLALLPIEVIVKYAYVKCNPVLYQNHYKSSAGHDNLHKLVLVGMEGTGKSEIILRFTDNSFNDYEYIPTIGVDFRFRSILIAMEGCK